MGLTHRWDLEPSEAIALQRELARSVEREPRLGPVQRIAGIDASYRAGVARAAIAIFSYPALTLVDYVVAERPVEYPYVPGLLSFREAPAVLDALEKLLALPDLLIFDAHGLAHPRRLGLACHVGLLADLPSVGCAKSRLCGQHAEPGTTYGSVAALRDDTEVIGAVVRTRNDVRPVFVSIGHRVDLPSAVHYVLGCCRGYRLPEVTRWADKIAGGARPELKAR